MATNEGVSEDELKAAAVAERVTDEQVEANIKSEIYFTARDAMYSHNAEIITHVTPSDTDVHAPLELLTLCVIVLANGFTVLGQSACASPENFNQEIGRKLARQDAKNKIWAFMGYNLRSKLNKENG